MRRKAHHTEIAFVEAESAAKRYLDAIIESRRKSLAPGAGEPDALKEARKSAEYYRSQLTLVRAAIVAGSAVLRKMEDCHARKVKIELEAKALAAQNLDQNEVVREAAQIPSPLNDQNQNQNPRSPGMDGKSVEDFALIEIDHQIHKSIIAARDVERRLQKYRMEERTLERDIHSDIAGRDPLPGSIASFRYAEHRFNLSVITDEADRKEHDSAWRTAEHQRRVEAERERAAKADREREESAALHADHDKLGSESIDAIDYYLKMVHRDPVEAGMVMGNLLLAGMFACK